MKYAKNQTLKTKLITFMTIIICLLSINCTNIFPKENQEEIKEIRKLYLLDEFEQAKTLATAYLEKYPKSPQGLMWRGKIAFILKDKRPAQYFSALGKLGTKALPSLIKCTMDTDTRVRVQAYIQMTGIKDPKTIKTFLDRLPKEQEDAPREVLVTAIGMYGDSKVIPKLRSIAVSYHETPAVNLAAVLAIANLVTPEKVGETLEMLAEDYNRVPALESNMFGMEKAAENIGKKYPKVVLDFILRVPKPSPDRMDTADDSYRMISSAASYIGKPMTSLLLKNYPKASGPIKLHLLRIISRVKDESEVEELLIRELKSSDNGVVRTALLGLKNFDSEKSNQGISELLDKPEFQATALRIISEHKNIKGLEEKIVPFADDDYYYNRKSSLFALRTINPQKHAALFADKLMNDPRAPVTAVAILGLAKSANSDNIQLLAKKLNEKTTPPWIRRQLIDSLRLDFMAQVTEVTRGVYKVQRHDLLTEDPLEGLPPEKIKPAGHKKFR